MNKKISALAFEGIAFQVVSMLLGLAWVFITARQLDVSSMGKVLVAFSAANTAITLFGMGLQHSIAVKSRDFTNIVLASNGVVAILCLGLVAALVSWAGVGYLVYSGYELGVSPLLCFSIVFFLFFQVYANALLRALHFFRVSNWLSVSQLAIFNLQILIQLLDVNKVTLDYVLMSFHNSIVAACLLTFASVLRLGGIGLAAVNLEVLKKIIGFGGKVQLGNILKEVMYKGDFYLVTWILGSTAAGLYGVVLKLIEAIGRFVDAVGLIILPVIAKANTTDRNRLTQTVVGVVFPASVVVTLMVSFQSPLVIKLLFGDGFSESAKLLTIGIFALIPLSLWKILANDIIGRGFANIYTLSSASGAISITFLNYLLLDRYGVGVAPWVLIISYAVAMAILLTAINRKTGIPVIKMFFYFLTIFRK